MSSFRYNCRLIGKSLRRDLWFTVVMVVSQALGVSIFVTALATNKRYSNMTGQIRPDVYRVEGHSRSSLRPFFEKTEFEGFGELARVYVTLPVVRTLQGTGLATPQTPTFVAEMAGGATGQAPQKLPVRFAGADLFELFNADFRYGGPWRHDDEAGSNPARVVVLSDLMNQTLFDGDDSIGKTVRLGGLDFRVVGVIRQRPGKLHLWDANIAPQDVRNLIVPFAWADVLRPRPRLFWPPTPTDLTWATASNASIAFVDYWVHLSGPAALAQFKAKMRQIDPDMTLRPADEVVARYTHAPPPYRIFLIFTLVVLETSVINLMRMLLAKANARAAEIGIHRALGAGRDTIFLRQLTEGAAVSLVGSVLGLVLAIPTIAAFDRLVPDTPVHLAITPTLVATTLLVCLAAGLISGIYPAWRVASVPPTRYLGKV